MKVFIVDDSAHVRERLVSLFSDLEEIEVIGQAQDAQEAHNALRNLKVDVVILDIKMPRGNGIEVLQNIKKNKAAPKVIMLTNFPYPQYRKKCMTLGADYFFDKSNEFDKVTEVFEQLINGTRH